MQNGTATVKKFGFKKNKVMRLLYSLAVLLLDVYMREMKVSVHTKTCTSTSRAALFVIAQNWKPPQCPSGQTD